MVFENWSSSIVKPGDKYIRLTVISTHKIVGTYKYYAKCQCSCGSEPFYVRIDALRQKEGKAVQPTKSCGCLQRERVTKHGAWGHPLYFIWKSMMERCYDPKNQRYQYYGAQGITVCEEWKNDVNKFIADMYPTYKKGLQIDRKDNDGNYNFQNCKWSTRTEQAQNRSNTVLIAFQGKTLCLSEWSRVQNINLGTLWERINVLGWSTDKALSTPVQKM
jgi:hypothetical protein